jgi:hypothetical protein
MGFTVVAVCGFMDKRFSAVGHIRICVYLSTYASLAALGGQQSGNIRLSCNE